MPRIMAASPYYRFYRSVRVPMPWQLWERMPRVPGFKNEYLAGEALYSPRPRTLGVELDLKRWSGLDPIDEEDRYGYSRERVEVRRLQESDWPELPEAFLWAFAQQPPLSQYRGGAPLRGARAILSWTRLGRDGPLVEEACHVAVVQATEHHDARLIGGALVTLERPARFCGMSDRRDEALSREPILPHLTWIFVGWAHQRHGVGSMLLDAAATALLDAGHTTLASTCSLDSPASVTWHWRHGFEPLPSGMSIGRYRRVGGDENPSKVSGSAAS